MPDHVHMVVARHRYAIETLIGFFKGDATRRLTEEGLHPLAWCARNKRRPPTPWVRSGWNVCLNVADEIRRAIRYANANPTREGHKVQTWSFITEYRG